MAPLNALLGLDQNYVLRMWDPTCFLLQVLNEELFCFSLVWLLLVCGYQRKICDFNVAKAALLGAVLEIGKIGR